MSGRGQRGLRPRDLVLGPEIAVEVAYVGLILMGGSSFRPDLTLWLGGTATALVVLAGLVNASNASPANLTNRGLVLLVVWLTALWCRRRIRAENELEGMSATLRREKAQVARRAVRARKALRNVRQDREHIEEELEEAEHRYLGILNQTFQLVAVL